MIRVGTSNERTRDEWVRRVLGALPPGLRILDAGAGESRYAALCGHLQYVSQDFAQYDGRGDGRGLHTGSWRQAGHDIVSDVSAIPQPDDSFGAVLCTEVLEHVPEPVSVLREFARLLKTGGYLILTAPFGSVTHFAPYYFTTGFSRNFYEYWLPLLGYEILELECNGNYFEWLAQETRRLQEVAVRYGDARYGIRERLTIRSLLGMLKRFAENDRGSAELLSFGVHVLARYVRTGTSGR